MPDLPIIDSCDGCGACCLEQASPPGYIWLMDLDEKCQSAWGDEEDIERFNSMPREAMRILRRYVIQLRCGEVSGEGVCVWFNQQTRQCRFYEHRPNICRDFERGCDGCHSWREKYSVAGVPNHA